MNVENDINNEEDFWVNLNDFQKQDIEKGISDLEEGKMIKFDIFIKKYL